VSVEYSWPSARVKRVDHGRVILDGGLSNALTDRGHDLSSDLWTAALLVEQPEEIAAVHTAYFEAGAQVVTTASYQASVEGFVEAGLSAERARAAISRSVTLGREARDLHAERTGRRGLVAASVGPYGAALADGSEYTGRYGVEPAQLRDFHAARLELLAAAGPDLLAVETIPDVEEAEVLVPLLAQTGLPVWFSYSIDGERTRAGQPLAEAFSVVADLAGLVAAGVNCCRPVDVLPAVRIATEITGRPAVAYPNAGEDWDAAAHAWRGTATYDLDLVPTWIDAGATFVGGCCRVGPDQIAALADRFSTALPGPAAG
jgi:homocysteine S-methyltransferase